MSDAAFETVSEHGCFGGTVGFYSHRSTANDCTMRFAVYRPPQAERGRLVSFRTMMTGEIYALLTRHGILGRLIPPGAP